MLLLCLSGCHELVVNQIQQVGYDFNMFPVVEPQEIGMAGKQRMHKDIISDAVEFIKDQPYLFMQRSTIIHLYRLYSSLTEYHQI